MNDNKKKILIIDDEEDLQEVVKEKLARDGFQIDTAYNAEDGLQKAFNEEPDLILLDVLIPNMNGLEVLKHFHAHKWGKHPKVIVLSALGHEDKKKRARALGAFDYLVKTEVTIDDVAKKVNEALNS
jgi:DNA-binding response OmpR family regulator